MFLWQVVLSACSTYFEQLLVQNPCQHPIIFMKDMKHWEVQALVDFMYKGEVNVSQDEISTLLKAAEALQIRGLCGADRQQDSNAVSLPPETTVSDSGMFCFGDVYIHFLTCILRNFIDLCSFIQVEEKHLQQNEESFQSNNRTVLNVRNVRNVKNVKRSNSPMHQLLNQLILLKTL